MSGRIKDGYRLLLASGFRQYQLNGERTSQSRRVEIQFNEYAESQQGLWNSGPYPYWLARIKLEDSDENNLAEGCWGINYRRMSVIHGDMGRENFEMDDRLATVSGENLRRAESFKTLVYARLHSVEEIRQAVEHGLDVRVGMEVGSEWYDPPNGKIPLRPTDWLPLSSHAVPFESYNETTRRFHFQNSWGHKWGDHGKGSVHRDNVKETAFEAWAGLTGGLDIPVDGGEGLCCVEWSWSPYLELTINVREIRLGLDRVAWAFCVRCHDKIRVDEFFVAPSHRRKGYARRLAEMVKELSRELGKPIELAVPFADSETRNLGGVEAVANLFGLHLYPSDSRFSERIARAGQPKGRGVWDARPTKAATILELLRPPNETIADDKWLYKVYFGTNRAVNMCGDKSDFGRLRGPGLTVGRTTVCVPKTHLFGSTGRFFLKRWARGVDDRLKVVQTDILDHVTFRSEAGAIRDPSFGTGKHLLFIHGYNVDFNEACIRGAQLGFDLKVDGHMFVYSWPSAGQMSCYLSDEASVEAAAPHFQKFMNILASQLGGQELDIVAHSMGNRLLTRWLDSNAVRPNISGIIFTAADVDTETFISQTKSVHEIAKQCTIYTATGDIPLALSEFVHGMPRAGLSPPIFLADNVETVDVRGLNLFSLGHDYFGTARDLLTDFHLFFRHGTSAKYRPQLIESLDNSGKIFWVLQL